MYVVEFWKKDVWYYRHDINDIVLTYDYVYQSKVQLNMLVPQHVYDVNPDFDLHDCHAIVLDELNNQIYIGYVSDVSETDVLLQSIIRRLDYDFLPYVGDNAHLEYVIEAHCQTEYMGNRDAEQNLPQIDFAINSETRADIRMTKVERFSDVMNLMLKQYQIVAKTSFDTNTGEILVVFERVTTPTIEIKSDIIQEIELMSKSTDVLNKVEYYDELFLYEQTWFLLDDNTVTTNSADTKRVLPPATKKKIINPVDFNFQADAEKELLGNIYNQEIRFTMSMDDELMDYNQLVIGTKLNIYTDNEVHKTLVTGITLDSAKRKVTILCGIVRSDISKILYENFKGTN